MPRFYTGDELGNIKAVTCSRNETEGSTDKWNIQDKILYKPTAADAQNVRTLAVQQMSFSAQQSGSVLSVVRANGSIQAFKPKSEEDEKLEVVNEWTEKRFGSNSRFVGHELQSKGAFWCTSNGALGFAPSQTDESSFPYSTATESTSLPKRLQSWKLSPDASSFCYGGEEVDLSVWNTERAFSSTNDKNESCQADGKKRKRGDELLPGEVWRAKNLPNDSLSLRQPINITSVTYIQPPSSGNNSNSVHLVTGTQLGEVRRYDTRAARRPVANWTGIGKVGGIGVVEGGLHEHELFVSDKGTIASALDLRNGRVLYSYKKLQGALTSFAPSISYLASTSSDRFFRLHSTVPPPDTPGKHQEERGDVLGSLYMKSVPIAVVIDTTSEDLLDDSDKHTNDDDVEEDPFNEMEDISEDEDEDEPQRRKKRV